MLVAVHDPIARARLCDALARAGHRLLQAADAASARASIEGRQPALAVLEVLLPGADGLELCRWIRARSDLPVIILTAAGDGSDRIAGLEAGADDCMTGPCSPGELAARARAVLRRTTRCACVERIEAGPLSIDPGERRVTRDGRSLRLTAREFDLLWFLARNPLLVFSRHQLMDRVWGRNSGFDTTTVTVHVRRLREKIEGDPSRPRHVQTIRGAGYRFVA